MWQERLNIAVKNPFAYALQRHNILFVAAAATDRSWNDKISNKAQRDIFLFRKI